MSAYYKYCDAEPKGFRLPNRDMNHSMQIQKCHAWPNYTRGPTLGGGSVGLGGLLRSPGTGSGTSAGLGCPEGPIVSRRDRFARVKAFVLADGAGPCREASL